MNTALAQSLPQAADYIRILPELILSLFGMAIMMLEPLMNERRSQHTLGTIALIGTLAALASTFWMAQYPGTAFWNMVRVEEFSVFFHILVIISRVYYFSYHHRVSSIIYTIIDEKRIQYNAA